jgi:hypothetical protein
MVASEQFQFTNASQNVDTTTITRVTYDTTKQSSDGRGTSSRTKATIKPGIANFSQAIANSKESYDRHGDRNNLAKPCQNGSVLEDYHVYFVGMALEGMDIEVGMHPILRSISERQVPYHNKLDNQEQPPSTNLNDHSPDDNEYDDDDHEYDDVDDNDDSLSVDSFRYYSNRW